MGDTSDDEYLATFKEQAQALAEGGVDIFAVETMMFPQEATAAIKACKAVADLPVMATMFFQYEEMHDRDRTMWGESPADVAKSLLGAGADIVGMNCGRGPDRAIVIIREMRAVTDAPLIAYPNAGLPITKGDTTTYELGPEAMAKDYPALLDAGCNIVGACCGSAPSTSASSPRSRAPAAASERDARRPLAAPRRPRRCPAARGPRRGPALPGLQEGHRRPGCRRALALRRGAGARRVADGAARRLPRGAGDGAGARI